MNNVWKRLFKYGYIDKFEYNQIINEDGFDNEKRSKQTLCSFCSTPLSDEDYKNTNDFFLSCHNHKHLAKMETEKHFKENPDYTKWQKPSV